MKRFTVSVPDYISNAINGYSNYEKISKAETVRQALIYFFNPVSIVASKKSTKQLFIEFIKSIFNR